MAYSYRTISPSSVSFLFLVPSVTASFLRFVPQYNNKMDDNVTNVFGATFLSSLVAFDLSLDTNSEANEEPDPAKSSSPSDKNGGPSTTKSPIVTAAKRERRILGMVSKAGAGVGRADNDRQFFYLNGRPVDLPKVTVLRDSCRTET